jgi:hypothetical protein
VLTEVSDRLPSLPMDLSANADGRTPTTSGAGKDAANKSVENLLAESRSSAALRVPKHRRRN